MVLKASREVVLAVADVCGLWPRSSSPRWRRGCWKGLRVGAVPPRSWLRAMWLGQVPGAARRRERGLCSPSPGNTGLHGLSSALWLLPRQSQPQEVNPASRRAGSGSGFRWVSHRSGSRDQNPAPSPGSGSRGSDHPFPARLGVNDFSSPSSRVLASNQRRKLQRTQTCRMGLGSHHNFIKKCP